MRNPAIESVRPVRFGILIGFLGLVFGVGWAFWLVLGHESIHQGMEQRAAAAAAMEKNAQADIKATGPPRHEENDRRPEKVKVHAHKNGAPQNHNTEVSDMAMAMPSAMAHHGEEKNGEAKIRPHGSPLMELAHTRLVRGHLHAMGLGLATILISLTLAFTTASGRVKTAASVLTGIGGIIYPVAWIVMGYMTPSLGPEAAEASVMFIAGPGVGLVLLGVFTAAFSI